MTATGLSILLRVDQLGRPPTANQRRRQQWYDARASTLEWRNAATLIAYSQHFPKMTAAKVTCWGVYPNLRSLPDPDGLSPALKAVLDGLVDAGVLEDDSARCVVSVTYQAPVVEPGCLPGLVVRLDEVAP